MSPALEDITAVSELPSLSLRGAEDAPPYTLEKSGSFDSKEVVQEKDLIDGKTEIGVASDSDSDEVLMVNGEPVIVTGLDVSRFQVDLRDDGDPALTFRSLFLGTVFAGLGAALGQVRPYRELWGNKYTVYI